LRIRSEISIKDRAKSKRRDSVALPSSVAPRDEGVASLTQNHGPRGFDSSERKARQGRIQYGTMDRNSLDRVQKKKNVLAGSRRCFQIRGDDR